MSSPCPEIDALFVNPALPPSLNALRAISNVGFFCQTWASQLRLATRSSAFPQPASYAYFPYGSVSAYNTATRAHAYVTFVPLAVAAALLLAHHFWCWCARTDSEARESSDRRVAYGVQAFCGVALLGSGLAGLIVVTLSGTRAPGGSGDWTRCLALLCAVYSSWALVTLGLALVVSTPDVARQRVRVRAEFAQAAQLRAPLGAWIDVVVPGALSVLAITLLAQSPSEPDAQYGTWKQIAAMLLFAAAVASLLRDQCLSTAATTRESRITWEAVAEGRPAEDMNGWPRPYRPPAREYVLNHLLSVFSWLFVLLASVVAVFPPPGLNAQWFNLADVNESYFWIAYAVLVALCLLTVVVLAEIARVLALQLCSSGKSVDVGDPPSWSASGRAAAVQHVRGAARDPALKYRTTLDDDRGLDAFSEPGVRRRHGDFRLSHRLRRSALGLSPTFKLRTETPLLDHNYESTKLAW